MQATVKGTVFGFGPVKHGIAALGIAAALAVGAVTFSTIERGGSSASVASQAVTTSQAEHQRFLELNTLLPEAARQATTDYRFLEMNLLPGDAAAANAVAHTRMLFLEANILPAAASSANVVSYAQARFLEANLWPEAAPVVRTAEDMRFWDANILPGDDQPNIPPYSVNTGQPY
jgi:hypothetical protein